MTDQQSDQQGQVEACPICDKGSLHPHVEKADERNLKGEPEADLHYSICDGCSSEITSGDDMSMNKKNMLAFLQGFLEASQQK